MKSGTTVGQTRKTMCKTFGESWDNELHMVNSCCKPPLQSTRFNSLLWRQGAPKQPHFIGISWWFRRRIWGNVRVHQWQSIVGICTIGCDPKWCKPQFTTILDTQLPIVLYYNSAFHVIHHVWRNPKESAQNAASWGGKGRTVALDVALCFVGRHWSHVHGLRSLQERGIPEAAWASPEERWLETSNHGTLKSLWGTSTDAEMSW